MPAPSALGAPASRRLRSRHRRLSVGLFALLFVAYAYFHQGGGWNQNGRFAQVRAVVEQGVLEIDDYLLYGFELTPDGTPGYRRLVLSEVDTRASGIVRPNTLDLSIHDAHYYPNKPPGVTLLAVPLYSLLYTGERAAGLDPDAEAVAIANLYLVTVGVAGLLAALAGVLFYDVSRRLFPDLPTSAHLGATLAFGLGTLVFPYATMLMDHAPVVAVSLLAFRWLLTAGDDPEVSGAWLFAAGTASGLGVLLNNSVAFTALALGAFAWARLGRRAALGYMAGGVAPALLLGGYHAACFGTPFAIPQHRQLDVFRTGAPLLAVFGAPNWRLLPELLVLPYRGLFFSSPVLLLAFYGGLRLWRGGLRAELSLCAAIFGFFLALNTSFNGWHGGSSFGPRYLIPALPFLALGMAPAFARWRVASLAVAGLSIGIMGLVTAVDPQVDVGFRNPLTDFYLPVARGETVRSDAFRVRGPVSAHAVGVAGADLELHAPDTQRQRWNSWNLGEAWFPHRWASLLPLLVVGSLLGVFLAREASGPPAVVENDPPAEVPRS